MEIKLIQKNGTKLAQINADGLLINNSQDALDIMADVSYQGADKIIIHKDNISPEFFDLKTGIAGEILQKFSNYGIHLAIVGDFSKYQSKSLRDFIFESNKHGQINFVATREEAIEKLSE